MQIAGTPIGRRFQLGLVLCCFFGLGFEKRFSKKRPIKRKQVVQAEKPI
jgi:hypothetical protein